MVTSLPTPVGEVTPGTRIVRALAGVRDLANAAQELLQAQIPGFAGGRIERLEGISFAAADLLVEGGVVRTRDEGVVLFHERISVDKPGLRAVLRKSDRRTGRLQRVRQTLAQRAYREAIRAGLVIRAKDGRLKGLSKQGRTLVNKAAKKQRAAEAAKRKKRQTSAVGKLRGFAVGGK